MYKQLILASQSPRRRELMASCEIPFTIINSQVDETLNPGMPLGDAVADLAYRKAMAVFEKHSDSVVIGADTIVVI
ncbi:MAG: Maf-like protein, partial [Erysipelotrichales bacterium]